MKYEIRKCRLRRRLTNLSDFVQAFRVKKGVLETHIFRIDFLIERRVKNDLALFYVLCVHEELPRVLGNITGMMKGGYTSRAIVLHVKRKLSANEWGL